MGSVGIVDNIELIDDNANFYDNVYPIMIMIVNPKNM